MRNLIPTLFLFLLAAWAAPCNAQTAPYTLKNTPQYQQCTAMTHSNPTAALAFADNWLKTSQEVGALHCRALALYGLGRFDESAANMDSLSDKVGAGQPLLSTSLLQQAAKAHELANQPDKALAQYNKAVDQASLNGFDQIAVSLLSSRAELLAKQGKYFDGLQDMDHAIALSQDPSLTLARAKIYKQMGALTLARKDVDETLRTDPENADAKALAATLPAPKLRPSRSVRSHTTTARRVAIQKKLAKNAKKSKKRAPTRSHKKKKRR